ncbi:MAG: hypothetical protein M1308_15685 [Actinobacteria bacterium]|nr:hypothetical protein [Actinomycetota bacterium]
MKKKLIKCDCCNRELTDKDAYYYELIYVDNEGWVRFAGNMSDFDRNRQICKNCAEEKKIDFKR